MNHTHKAEPSAELLGIATINPPAVAGLAAVTEDARIAGVDLDPGPAEPTDYRQLRGRLEAVRDKLPPLYRQSFVEPYIKTLNDLGEAKFARVLRQDPQREGSAGLLLDAAQAILQQGEGYAAEATDAFQEVVSDLYDGFLSAEDRRGVKAPDQGVIPPLVKWGNPEFGPYTWPVDATTSLGVAAGIVNLPPAQMRAGIAGWAALGHETAGHDILHADDGLQAELAEALRIQLAPLGHGLADYWADRIDETASDVCGILNMGPAAGIGLIALFRGLSAAYGDEPKLRSVGPDQDPHPADILRGFLAAETVALLKFTGHGKWSRVIAEETNRDVTRIVVAGEAISADLARQSAAAVAKTLVTYKAESLELHALGDIQNWRDKDELRVRTLRAALRTGAQLASDQLTDTYAAHVVAAGVVETVSDGSHASQLSLVFGRMLSVLKAMHDSNPSWGPLFVLHPGSLRRDRWYIPRRTRAGSTTEAFLLAEASTSDAASTEANATSSSSPA